MPSVQKMSGSELEVMRALWALGGEATSAQLHQSLSRTREWKLNTVLTFLARLEEKGLTRAEKLGRGRPARYIARVSEEAYRHTETREFLDQVHHGSVTSLMTALCGDAALSREEVLALRTWFDSLPDGE